MEMWVWRCGCGDVGVEMSLHPPKVFEHLDKMCEQFWQTAKQKLEQVSGGCVSFFKKHLSKHTRTHKYTHTHTHTHTHTCTHTHAHTHTHMHTHTHTHACTHIPLQRQDLRLSCTVISAQGIPAMDANGKALLLAVPLLLGWLVFP